MELRGLVVVPDPWDDARAEPSALPAIEPVANRPIAHHVLDALQAAGVTDVIVVTSQRAEAQVRACLASCTASPGGSVRVVGHRGPVDLVSALAVAAPVIGDSPCIVHAGGGLLAEPLAPLAGAVDGAPDAIITVHQTPSPDQRLSPAVQRLLHLAELDPARSALGVAGVWAFGRGAVQRAAGAAVAAQVPPPVDGADAASGLAAVAERISSGGGSIRVRLVDAWRVYQGRAGDLLELNRIALERIDAGLAASVAASNRVEGRVRVHDTASVTDSVLVGPIVIGPRAQISDAYIGPYTAIGAGCRIEGAEIERSIVSPDARVSHVGSRITDSVVGPGAHLFRDFSVPRALRVRVGADAELGLC
jgi:glucose-1-phosphate thymidylyltransferase